jgi:hypothetical protein
MALKWWSVVVDCHDLHAQARWWAECLDWHVVLETADEAVVVPRHVTELPKSEKDWRGLAPALVFVQVPEAKAVKNRLHLDLSPLPGDDRDAIIEDLVSHGAARVDVGQAVETVSWTVLTDPEGNEFCVLSGLV